ncbi:MAG: CRISPR-associated protein [Selenomonadaceae bacterium]|nr:CRISPR-associated protein [Selenomonadaceae bacterium]
MPKKIFVNHTNHPSTYWSEPQLTAARAYGDIMDVPFPNIPPDYSPQEVRRLAQKYFAVICDLKPAAVLCQGDFSYTFAMVNMLKEAGIVTLAATSQRIVTEAKTPGGSTQKVSLFEFVRFREY